MSDETTKPPEDSNLVEFKTKLQVEEEKVQKLQDDLLNRQFTCTYNELVGGKCTCNYCIFLDITAKMLVDIAFTELVAQSKKGSMNFSFYDVLRIFEKGFNRVVEIEKSYKKQKNPQE